MQSKWPLVSLRECLQPALDFVEIEPSEYYPIAGVYSFGKGLLSREAILGSQTSYKKFIRLHKGEFLISKLKAWEGALAKVPKEFDGWFVSPQFITFKVVSGKLDIDYLNWFFKQPKMWKSIERKSHGMGARRISISIEKFLEIEIPLPPLDEQKRIVARIESLMARIEEARRLRAAAVKEAEKIIETQLENIFFMCNEWEYVQFGNSDYFKINPSKSELKDFDLNMEVSFIPMKKVDPSKGRIVGFEKRRLFEVKKGHTYFAEGDVLFAKITPCMENGNIAIAKNLTNKIGFGSTEFHVIRVLKGAIPEWVYYLFRTKKFRKIAERNMTGTAGQRRVPKKFIENFQIPLPPLPVQRRIVAYLDSLQAKVDELKRLQEETEREMEELVPSILDRAFKGEL